MTQQSSRRRESWPGPLRKGPSRAHERQGKLKAQQAEERRVYAAVTARDKRKCRACGKEANPSALALTRRGHHHHIVFRSAGGATTTANVCLACGKCHADVHAYRLTISGNADQKLKVTRIKEPTHGA